MRHLSSLLLATALAVLSPNAAQAQLPTCSNVMQFGVDCQIGDATTGGIVLSGFSQTITTVNHVNAATSQNAGGLISFELVQTSSSRSRLRLTFNAAGAGAIGASVLPDGGASSVFQTASAREQLSMTIAGIGSTNILSAVLGRGTTIATPTCGRDYFNNTVCGAVSSTVAFSVNESASNGGYVAAGTNTLEISRTTFASASTGDRRAQSAYACGTFLTNTCYRYAFFGGGVAATPDEWVYEFELQGTGPAASPPTVAVPEPQSLALLSAGLAALMVLRRRRQQRG